MRTPRALLLLAVLLTLPSPALAKDSPLDRSGVYLPVGITLGGSYQLDGRSGFVIGAEVSLATFRADSGLWYGLYMDGVADLGPKAFRMSVGGEVGWSVFGLDAGFLATFQDGTTAGGFQLRGLFTLSYVAAYARVGWLPDGPLEGSFGEFGLLLKFPFRLAMFGEKRQWREPQVPREEYAPDPLPPEGPAVDPTKNGP